ncbi:glycosyltransferase family 2 protein [bacterium]|nr:glycosyltransferase family 2 protein [candidate division CSSED10-310 bacterium]
MTPAELDSASAVLAGDGQPVVTVVIPTYNGAHHLSGCLDALQQQEFTAHEVIVVDNGSTDGTLGLLLSYPRVRVIALDRNHGFAGAVNRGIEASGTPYIALLNNDTIPDRSWLAELMAAMECEPRPGSCASKMVLMEPAGHIDTAGDGFTIAGFAYKHGWMEEESDYHDTAREVFGACAGAALYRLDALQDAGLFDESFFAFEEDVDLAFRLQLAGYSCRYAPQARVLHKMRATAGRESDLSIYLCYRNLTMLLVKNLPAPLLVLYAPHILLHAAGVLLRHSIKGRLPVVCRAYIDACKALPRVFDMRRAVQRRRRVPLRRLRKLLDGNWPAVLWRLSSTVRSIRKRWRNHGIDNRFNRHL